MRKWIQNAGCNDIYKCLAVYNNSTFLRPSFNFGSLVEVSQGKKAVGARECSTAERESDSAVSDNSNYGVTAMALPTTHRQKSFVLRLRWWERKKKCWKQIDVSTFDSHYIQSGSLYAFFCERQSPQRNFFCVFTWTWTRRLLVKCPYFIFVKYLPCVRMRPEQRKISVWNKISKEKEEDNKY